MYAIILHKSKIASYKTYSLYKTYTECLVQLAILSSDKRRKPDSTIPPDDCYWFQIGGRPHCRADWGGAAFFFERDQGLTINRLGFTATIT